MSHLCSDQPTIIDDCPQLTLLAYSPHLVREVADCWEGSSIPTWGTRDVQVHLYLVPQFQLARVTSSEDWVGAVPIVVQQLFKQIAGWMIKTVELTYHKEYNFQNTIIQTEYLNE